ncbi:MAG: 50S ribosomal protein L6, partial [Desulfitobacteriaceae bacterium]
RPSDEPFHRSLHGLTRTLIANMVEGVTKGFTKGLELVGVGYRASKQGDKLVLTIGKSHPVEMLPYSGLEIEVPVPTKILVKGMDKETVGAFAAVVRKQRPPEPYKGKGIKYEGEIIRRKVGKTGGKKGGKK